ncbi:MAG: transposase [Bacteroidia bacterium]|nr:transposase [Bacteroidia bacterium]
MQKIDFLESSFYYHIFNRGNNGENIFIEDRNYRYFIELLSKHISSVADIYCYCLLKNHFHLLVRIKEQIPENIKNISQPFSNFFNADSKSINKAYNRTGSLFDERFERRRITDEQYLKQVVVYIHLNPVKHDFTENFKKFSNSSYQTIISDKLTILKNDEVINWFDDINNFIYCHRERFIRYENIIEEIERSDY